MMRWYSSLRMMIAALAITLAMAPSRGADNPPLDKPPADDMSSSHGDIDKTKTERAEPGKEWWRDVVARFPGCSTLSDGCQSCVPKDDGLTCSNPGIACTRTEWRCSAPADQKADPQDDKTAPKELTA